MKECTFKPNINKNAQEKYDKRNLYDLHKQEGLIRYGKTMDQCEFERDMKEYTFNPSLNKKIPKKTRDKRD